MAKDIAKQEWTEAENKRKTLEKDVKQLEKTIAAAPISRESFYTRYWCIGGNDIVYNHFPLNSRVACKK